MALDGKPRAAFRSGFLGVPSLGWSTLVQIVEASEQDRARARRHVGGERCTSTSARPISPPRAPRRKRKSCSRPRSAIIPKDTLIAVRRTFEDGAIREAFRTLHPRGGHKPMRAFTFLEVEGEEEPGETVDLATLAKGERNER